MDEGNWKTWDMYATRSLVKGHFPSVCISFWPFWIQEVIGLIQTKNFTPEDELNFDLEEFLDFNKVPGLDDEPSVEVKLDKAEPDLT